MRKALSVMLVLMLTMMSISCASMQMPTPKTAPEKLVYAFGLVDGVASMTESLYRAKVIDKEEAQDAYDTLQKTWSALNIAKSLYYAGDEGYELNLETAMEMTEALRAFLLERSRE